MRVVLVCGDRNWLEGGKIYAALRKEHTKRSIDFVVEGGALGADYLAKLAANNLGIQAVECPALWSFHGKKAGPIRNQKQLDVALVLSTTTKLVKRMLIKEVDLLVLAFHSDLKNSKGTKDMVNRAKKAGVKVKVIE